MNDITIGFLCGVLSLSLLFCLVMLSERRDMQDAKEDIGCVWVETGGDTMVRECK